MVADRDESLPDTSANVEQQFALLWLRISSSTLSQRVRIAVPPFLCIQIMMLKVNIRWPTIYFIDGKTPN
jgi:TRAP-type mannitol/chloroaromatic compound transport system permease large subunit